MAGAGSNEDEVVVMFVVVVVVFYPRISPAKKINKSNHANLDLVAVWGNIE